ncbi:MAG: DUF2608 domain-containing protein [Alphaproteobacteria bacterium]|nr:DUF2608 domain-containing protein [Alphaproteobacteria bacterium]
MKKTLTILAFVFLSGIHATLAEISKTSDLVPIELAIKQADSETLVIFDVDDVLITARDQILQAAHKKFLEGLNKGLESRLSEEEAQKLWGIIWLARSDEPVDPKMVSLIKEAQSKGLKVMALTNAWTGPFGVIPSLQDWRIEELEDFGYVFKDSWKTLKAKTFEALKSKDPERFPVFKEGVVFTCNLPKGEVLKALLDYANLSPKKIIFVDDKEKNLKSVEAFAREVKIPFIGFQYTAVVDRPKSLLNEKRAQLQFEVLEKEHKWLSDEEADKQR